jgi:excisionase family DNA binding protein
VTGGAPSSLASTRFLTIFEVAAILRISRQTIYRLVHSGELEAIKIGGAYRIPDRALQPRAPGTGEDRHRAPGIGQPGRWPFPQPEAARAAG